MIGIENPKQVPSALNIKHMFGGHPRYDEENSPVTSSLVTKNRNNFSLPLPPFFFFFDPDAELKGKILYSRLAYLLPRPFHVYAVVFLLYSSSRRSPANPF